MVDSIEQRQNYTPQGHVEWLLHEPSEPSQFFHITYSLTNRKSQNKEKREISYQLHLFQASLAQVSAEQKVAQECQAPSDMYVG